MKFTSFVTALVLAGLAVPAFAQTATAPAGGGKAMSIPQCAGPIAACKTAGFVVGAHKKGDKEGADNGLWVDCIDAAADGKKTVAGLSAADAASCRAAKKAMKAGH